MIFDILFYSSIAICIIGTCYKIVSWTKKTGRDKIGLNFSHGFSDFNILSLLRSFFFDVLFQGRILKTSMLRWLMHFLIFAGFMALLFMHAFDNILTENLFAYYYSTLNPFFFLRNLFAMMVLSGIAIAVYRRYILRPARLKNARADLFAIIILVSIISSGILLEGMKMTSLSEFTAMVEDYAGLDYEDEDTLFLETYWVKEFALVSTRINPPFENDVLDLGIEIHEANCMDCHSTNKSAFMGYTTAKLISPAATFLDKINGVTLFYYIHIIFCFLGLALLPFTKMFHIVATPISLMTNSMQNRTVNIKLSTKQFMELDACTHCSTCNLNCSAGMMYEAIGNDYILPSEKMQVLKKAVLKDQLQDQLNDGEFTAIFQGLYLCTNCDRCTVVCPSGIDLKSLWLNAREIFIQQSKADPVILSAFSFVRGLNPANIKRQYLLKPLVKVFEKLVPPIKRPVPLKINNQTEESDFIIKLPAIDTFSDCFGCQNCSTICPVVANFQKPEEMLTLLPHQIMYSLGLGMVDMAKSSAMLWNCLNCYQCQEHCPQNVAVTDILFQLKNKVFKNIQDKNP